MDPITKDFQAALLEVKSSRLQSDISYKSGKNLEIPQNLGNMDKWTNKPKSKPLTNE